jgi:hypothetical protein
MKIRIAFWTAFLSFAILGKDVDAQNLFNRIDSIQVSTGVKQLKLPWAGGINFAQFSAIDLDGDGLKDLMTFDRTGNKLTTYLNKGTPNVTDYVHAPEYQSLFPSLHEWVLLVDYDCDGKEDIFGYSNGGMQIWRNEYTTAGGLKFSKMKDILFSWYFSTYTNLYVSPINIPAFVDVDNDGDIDILTFDILGTRVEYHKNLSIETFGNCDSLLFSLQTQCWGNFALNSMSNSATLGLTCRESQDLPNFNNYNRQHGGSSILSIDMDNDNDKDLLIGDILGNNMLYLTNGGTSASAVMSAQDTLYPASHPVNVYTYPAPFWVDVDNDTLRDLIVTPTYLNNFSNVWFYKNTGTNASPVFVHQKNNLLVDEMIDLGEGANPVLFDADADGKKDLLVGNYGYYQTSGNYKSGISLYKNTGTVNAPAFEFVTNDYAGLNSLNINGLYPAFGDLDGDGDQDMLLGNDDGTVHYFVNTAGPGNPANFVLQAPNYQGIDVGQYSAPQLIDVNQDGLLDLVLGKRSGTVSYYENTGTTTNAVFTLQNNKWGDIDVKELGYVTGYSSPWLFKHNGGWRLFVGSERGTLFLYGNIDNNLSGIFTKMDTVYQNIFEGSRVSLGGGDINNDGLFDLFLGNYAGGISVYYQTTLSGNNQQFSKSNTLFDLFPNPANSSFTVKLNLPSYNSPVVISISDIMGRIIHSRSENQNSAVLIEQNMKPGVYFVTVTGQNSTQTQKLVVR